MTKIVNRIKENLGQPLIPLFFGMIFLFISVYSSGYKNYWDSKFLIVTSIRKIIKEVETIELSLKNLENKPQEKKEIRNVINSKKYEIYGKMQSLSDIKKINFSLDNPTSILSSNSFYGYLAEVVEIISIKRNNIRYYSSYIFLAAALLLPLLGVAMKFQKLGLSWQEEYQATSIKVDNAQKEMTESPDKSVPAWNMARATLEEYYNRNLSQIRMIFLASVIAMTAGFLLVCTCVILGFFRQNNKSLLSSIKIINSTPENIEVRIEEPDELPEITSSKKSEINQDKSYDITVIGIIAGIITNFIGATFLFLYQSTIKQASKYAQSLENINSVGMSMYILDSLNELESDTSKEKIIEAKVTISKLLIQSQISQKKESDDDNKNNKLPKEK